MTLIFYFLHLKPDECRLACVSSSDLLDEDYVWQEYFELESKYDDNDFPREKAMKLCKSAVASPLQNDFTVLVGHTFLTYLSLDLTHEHLHLHCCIYR